MIFLTCVFSFSPFLWVEKKVWVAEEEELTVDQTQELLVGVMKIQIERKSAETKVLIVKIQVSQWILIEQKPVFVEVLMASKPAVTEVQMV